VFMGFFQPPKVLVQLMQPFRHLLYVIFHVP
jgi:hypothetical protein